MHFNNGSVIAWYFMLINLFYVLAHISKNDAVGNTLVMFGYLRMK